MSGDRPISGGTSFESFLAQAVPESTRELLESNPGPVLQPRSKPALSTANGINSNNHLQETGTQEQLILPAELQELHKPDGNTSFNNEIQIERNIEIDRHYPDRLQHDIDSKIVFEGDIDSKIVIEGDIEPKIVFEGDIEPIVIPLQQSLATINLPELFNSQEAQHQKYNLELELPTDLETKGTDQTVIIYARLVPQNNPHESTVNNGKNDAQPELGGYFVIDIDQLIRIIKPQLQDISSLNENPGSSNIVSDLKRQNHPQIITDLPESEKNESNILTDNLTGKFGITEDLKSIIGELKSYYSEQFSRIESQSKEQIPVTGMDDDYHVRLDTKTGETTFDRIATSPEVDVRVINNNGNKENIQVPVKLGTQSLIQLLEIAENEQSEVIINELSNPKTNERVQLVVKPEEVSQVLQQLLSVDSNDSVINFGGDGQIFSKEPSIKSANEEPYPLIKVFIKSSPETIRKTTEFTGFNNNTSENIPISGPDNSPPANTGRNEDLSLKILDIPEDLKQKITGLRSSGKEKLSFSVELTLKDEESANTIKSNVRINEILEKLVNLAGNKDKSVTLISRIESLPHQISKDIQSLKIDLNLAVSSIKNNSVENNPLQSSGINRVFTEGNEIIPDSKDITGILKQPLQSIDNRNLLISKENFPVEFDRTAVVKEGGNIVITLKEQLTGNRDQNSAINNQPDAGFSKDSQTDALKPVQAESKISISINKDELSNLLLRRNDASENIKVQVSLNRESQTKPAVFKISHIAAEKIMETVNNYENEDNKLNTGNENGKISRTKFQLSGNGESESNSKDVLKSSGSSLRGIIETNDLSRNPNKVDSPNKILLNSNDVLEPSGSSLRGKIETNELSRNPGKVGSPIEILENSRGNSELKRPVILRIPVQTNYSASSEGEESVENHSRAGSKISDVNSGGGKVFSNLQDNLPVNLRNQVKAPETQPQQLSREIESKSPKNIPVIIESNNPEQNGTKVQGMLVLKSPDSSKNGVENHQSDTILEEISEKRHPGQVQSLEEERFGTSQEKGNLLPKGNSNDKINAPKQLFEIPQDKVISTQTILEYTTNTKETTDTGRPAPVFNIDDLADQMVRHAKLSVKKGVSEIKIQLVPPHLGKMTLNIKIENNQLLASVRVDTAEAKQLVQDNLHQLRETMAERGVEIQKFDVSVNQEFRDQMNLYKWNGNDYKRNGNNENQNSRNNQNEQAQGADLAPAETTRRFGYNTMELIA